MKQVVELIGLGRRERSFLRLSRETLVSRVVFRLEVKPKKILGQFLREGPRFSVDHSAENARAVGCDRHTQIIAGKCQKLIGCNFSVWRSSGVL